jgi:hypothetical protein
MGWIVMCRVSGGMTGTREAPLKTNGQVRYFDSHEAAAAEAARLMSTNHPYSLADFRYWPEEA